jgi:hypothetical protein
MAVANITSFGEKSVGYVEFEALGLTWFAYLIPSGRATSVFVSCEGLDSVRFATSVPAESIESDEDISFVLGKWDVVETLHDIATEEQLDGFDYDEYDEIEADNSIFTLSTGKVPIGKKHGFSVGLALKKDKPIFGRKGKTRSDVN